MPRVVRSSSGAGLIVKAFRKGREYFIVFTSIGEAGRAVYIVPPIASPYCLRVGVREARLIVELLKANYASLCKVAPMLYRDSVRETLGVLIEYGLVDRVEAF